ncbi:MAG: DUF4332 domain-containing protein [Verrucomicrobiota bacterium]
MLKLNEIPGIDSTDAELLDMAGIRDAKHLAEQDLLKLLDKLKRANDILQLSNGVPDETAVETWIHSATEAVSQNKNEFKNSSLATAVNYEGNEQVAEMLANAPCAIPLPGKYLMEKKIRVSDIPAGLLLNRYSGDLDVRIGNPELPQGDVPQRRQAAPAQLGQKAQPKNFDPSNLRAIDPNAAPVQRVAKSKAGHEEDRVALIRAPRESTNRGKNPKSRNYIRGVLHTHPWHLRVGAVFTLILLPLVPIAIISGFLLLLTSISAESFPWVPKWLIAFPIALPVIGIGYLFWGLTGKCRICSQKLFAHKRALKHAKAHRLFYLGYVVPLSIHLLLFSWFRCSSCGTPVRLKK